MITLYEVIGFGEGFGFIGLLLVLWTFSFLYLFFVFSFVLFFFLWLDWSEKTFVKMWHLHDLNFGNNTKFQRKSKPTKNSRFNNTCDRSKPNVSGMKRPMQPEHSEDKLKGYEMRCERQVGQNEVSVSHVWKSNCNEKPHDEEVCLIKYL